MTATLTPQGLLGSTRYFTRVGQGAVEQGIQTLIMGPTGLPKEGQVGRYSSAPAHSPTEGLPEWSH